MDPRQSLSRTASSNVQQNPYNPNNMASSYTMPPYQNANHLPPINYSGLPPASQHAYMPQQQFRNDLPRYPNTSTPNAPDRYNSHMSAQNTMQGLPPASMLPQPHNQQPQPQNYQNQQATRQNYPQPLAPAPPRPNLDPLSNTYGQPDNRQSTWSGAEAMPSMTSDVGRDPTRTHVVGSQGRRGILPSAPGRAPVMPNGLNGSPKGNQIPAKDADGKFPCPNCTKTYLHAKHLKRHMLRHTGDRPYMCVLCNDTFSRSDILKRHFQKCSVRRGNPTGASHLSNPAAHLKKSQAAAAKAAGTASPASATTPVSAGMPPGVYSSSALPSNSIPTTAGGPPQSMSYAMTANGQNDMSRPPPNQSMAGGQGQGGMDPNGNNSWAMHNARNPQMMYHQNSSAPDHFGMQQAGGDDKRSMPNTAHMEEWGQMFPSGGNEQYMNPMFTGYDQSQGDVKKEFDNHEGGTNGYYIPSTSLGADGTLGPSLWNLNAPQEDPLQLKAERLVDFCFPFGVQESLQEQQNNFHIRSCLTVDAIKHFIDLYPNFQGHFPWLHLPTFNLLEAYDGLILVIICSGAVYSDRVSQYQVRALLQRAKEGIEKTATVLRHLDTNSIRPGSATSGIEFEELLSLLMLYNIIIWHGGPTERTSARTESRKVLLLARKYGMLTLAGPNNQHCYSYLHNLAPGEQADPSRWDWYSWLEQEKRSRLMFLCFTFDAAMAMYFNVPPSFSAFEIKLPLPADDAAWDASDAETCAQALGLRGPGPQSAINRSGSLRLKSLECHHAIQALHSTSVKIAPRTTNVYSKFILIHALHVEIWQLHRQHSLADSLHSSNGTGRPMNGNYTISKDSYPSLHAALARWKLSWDQDMKLQYPPSNGLVNAPRRLGFCRDGVQFYWLARALVQPDRMLDWQLPADTRFRQLMAGLKNARDWSLSDGAERGEEPGSVAFIDDEYASSENMELDMRKFFRPLSDA